MKLGYCLVLGAMGLFACGSSSGAGGAGGSGSSTGSGAVCYSVPVNDATDGKTPCASQNCLAGQYCFDMVGICDQGCSDDLNCAKGQTCDTSSGMKDQKGNVVGVCRAPKTSEQIACKTTTTTTTSTGGTGNCTDRCTLKATTCGAPSTQAASECTAICSKSPTETQISCLEGTSCMALVASFQSGTPVCGLTY